VFFYSNIYLLKFLKPIKSITTGNYKNKYPWLFLIISATIILVLSPLFQKGTFIDGMLYKTVAYNFAHNLSTFWQMKFTDTSMVFFCEQPPLYFYLLGSIYKLLGDTYLVDRIFTLLLFLLLLLILKLIVNKLFKRPDFYFLLSVFFVLSISVICWSYANQIIEPLVSVFTLLGILITIHYIQSQRIFYIFLFFINLYLLFLSKGFQSCFIIGFPVIYFLLARFRNYKIFIFFIIAAIFISGLTVFLNFYKPAEAWFNCYYNTRLILTMNNVGYTTNNHFEIIGRFFSELMIPLIVVLIVCAFIVFKKRYPLRLILKNFWSNKVALALLLTSFLGSFPYAVSLVQRGFYLIPAIHCFLLALLFGLKRYWLFLYLFTIQLASNFIFRISMAIVLLICITLFFCQFGAYKREKELNEDVVAMLPYIQKRDTVLIQGDMWNYFSLHALLYMGKQINLSTQQTNQKYFICKKMSPGILPSDYTKLNLNTSELDLFVKYK